MSHRIVVVSAPGDEGQLQALRRYLLAGSGAGVAQILAAAEIEDDATLVASIDAADLVLVLLTERLVASTLWNGTAMQATKEAASRDKIPVVPIVVGECDWRSSWLGQRVALPRSGPPISAHRGGSTTGWAEIMRELKAVLQTRPPRNKEGVVAAPAERKASSSAAVTADFTGAARAYRLLGDYHRALLRVVDMAARAAEAALGPLQHTAWAPGVLHHPAGRATKSDTGPLESIPLQRVSYTWAGAREVIPQRGRLVLVHDGAPEMETGGAASAGTISVFAIFATRQDLEVYPG
ncbi:MAG: hypothetical protein R3B70_49150, partial [Polyangiaceae bacterium]